MICPVLLFWIHSRRACGNVRNPAGFYTFPSGCLLLSFLVLFSFLGHFQSCRPERLCFRIVYRRRSPSRTTGSLTRFRIVSRQELALTVVVAKLMRSVMDTNGAVQMRTDLHATSRPAEAEGLLRDL